jgi:uncharacterized membrane protein YbhN (UPF0104 family)
MRIRKRIWTILAWLTGLVIIGFIFRQMDIGQVAASLWTASFRLLTVSVALMLIAHCLRVSKWYVVLRDEYDGFEVTLLFFSSKALGDLSPARLGEFAPLLSGKYRSGKVAALLLVDRFFEASATLFFGAIGVLLLRFRDLRIIAGGVAIFMALSVAFVMLASPQFWEAMQKALDRWPVLREGLRVAASVSRGFDTFKGLSWWLWCTSMVATALGLFFFQTLFLSVGVQVSWSQVATMTCVAAIAALIAFTPWGLGIVEAPLWWLGRLYGLPPAGLGAFYVLVRIIPLSSTWLLYGLSLLICRYRKAPASS